MPLLQYTKRQISKKLLYYAYKNETTAQTLSNDALASLLKLLGDISVDAGSFDEGITFANKSIKLSKGVVQKEILIAENLKNIGYAYHHKNYFDKAKNNFEMALALLAKTGDSDLKNELESEIYARLALLYTYSLNKNIKQQAETYSLKSLEIINASEIFSRNSKEIKQELSCWAVRHRTTLGRVYSQLCQFDDAILKGFLEAEYIIEKLADRCPSNLAKAYIELGLGQAQLRKGNLNTAEIKLTQSIKNLEKLVGEYRAFEAKTYRAETRIRLKKFEEAYNDCLSSLKTENKLQDNYSTLVYLTNYYHAAIIKYKQRDYKSSFEHFSVFFSQAKIFCSSFLNKELYDYLDEKEIFKETIYQDNEAAQIINVCLQRSLEIFTTIYCSTHPFIADYVKKN